LPAAPHHGLDGWIDAGLAIFIEMKAFAVFSLLFGAGLAIQHERLAASGRSGLLLARRMLVLLVFGLVHMLLIWNGDILTEYALAGMVVLALAYWHTSGLVWGAVFCLAIYLLVPWWSRHVPLPDAASLQRHVAAAMLAYGSGDFATVLEFRLRELPAILLLHVYVFPRTVALMLLGALAWRTGLIKGPAARSARLWPASWMFVAAGLALTLAGSARGHSGWPRIEALDVIARPLAPILLALGYSAFIVALADGGQGRRWLAWAEPVGRMAFTNYVLQSIILGFIFYGYGLGQFGRLDLAEGLAIVLGLFALQVITSRIWLSRFHYGPLEWLWRMMTYGAAPRLLISRADRVTT
jgi:uncharacterized protein